MTRPWGPADTRWRAALACAALLLAAWGAWAWVVRYPVAADKVAAPRWNHDAYIWQMLWTDSLRTAVHDQRDVVHAWRVLFTQVRLDARVRQVAVDAGALQSSGRPVVVVVRMEGQLAQWDAPALQTLTLAALERARAAGINVAGLEIDHDCATARLPQYTQFLQQLRSALPPATPLTITTLPTWLGAPELPALLASVDQVVLQVHAVQNPRQGLFDATQALAWARAMDQVSPVPFRMALPTYGSRVHFDALGNYTAVESEAPALHGSASGTELVVLPQDMAGLMADPALAGLKHLQGFAWFRLPTADDRRSWNAATWRALLTGAPLQPMGYVLATPAGTGQVYDLALSNTGTTDLPWPDKINLPADCTQLDGSQGYAAVPAAMGGPHLRNTQARLLAPGRAVRIGWARCSTPLLKEWHVPS